MPRTELDYGPSMLETIEIGDRFQRVFGQRGPTAFVVEGKIYNDDMTITYQMRSTRGRYWKRSDLHESTLRKSGHYHRTFKAPRTVLMTEKIFTGAPDGTA